MDELDLSEFDTPKRETRCLIGALISTMTDEQKAKLEAVMPLRSVTATRITEVIEAWGYPKPNENGMRRHRRGGCNCGD